ncbi:hypothetical protein FT663_05479 [Candidozyma haemuli var. vulneris]|nr:hypothetical protein FT663_05479 [[Candida] haemuloni var. vulneris]KAF3985276.1 hypothetical protein FT662_05240 [[Candida] haemuloni var. vulneris]
MNSNPDQIYSATYSNVPVFEFVTSEGPIMRRKSDGWINATHILKIAKFPKAKRTRILEKDVQTGVHEKVQGGYGKYQGTYVPLESGAGIARMFGVYEVLEPIFKFSYVEGKSETPPPAPKHNHASASNIARRQPSIKTLNDSNSENGQRKKIKMEEQHGSESLKKRGRPKRVPLERKARPGLEPSQTVPITHARGPSMGTFSSKQDSTSSHANISFPSLTRQETEKDVLQIMASNLSVRNDDLESDTSADEIPLKSRGSRDSNTKDDDDDFMSGRELFGIQESFAGRDSFEKIIEMHKRNRYHSHLSSARSLSNNGANMTTGLMHYHNSQNHFDDPSNRLGTNRDDYFSALLDYFLHDDHGSLQTESRRTYSLPQPILNPPEPLSSININQRVDNDGNSILHWVCAMANLPVFQFLTSKFSGIMNLGNKNYSGENPLMFMIKFNNSYQQRNFNDFLQPLADLIFTADDRGQTVLHHIANLCKPASLESRDLDLRRSKERYASYYLESILSQASRDDHYSLNEGNSTTRFADLLNHQDQERNTPLHLFAYHLNKKCIKTLIKFHRVLNLELRNAVGHSVEDYLASNNYVLRIENDGSEDLEVASHSLNQSSVAQTSVIGQSQTMETQVQNTKSAICLQNTMSNSITERLSELAYAIDRELGEKDKKLLSLCKCLRKVSYEKYLSQKASLGVFKLDYLIEDMEKDFDAGEYRTNKADGGSLSVDTSRDIIIQEEISRLSNDMSFQSLVVNEELQMAWERYRFAREKILEQQLTGLVDAISVRSEECHAEARQLAISLQREIRKRKNLSGQVYSLDGTTPIIGQYADEFKENEKSGSSSLSCPANSHGVISTISQSDKLYKYCKLIALSCGMSFSEVESSIDLIEQSLLRGKQ